MLSQGLRFAEWQEELRVEERRLERRIASLADGDRTVLVGPWSGEVGFELLYWIPFVTWALTQAAVSPDRIVVVSQGRTGVVVCAHRRPVHRPAVARHA